jgi:hypothetical protein
MDDEVSIDDTMAETLAGIEAGASGDEGSAQTPPPAPSSPQGSNGYSGTPAVPAAQAAPEPWQSMPKSWRREMGEYWGRQDPAVQRYIHEREEQALRGIGQYKSVADQWSNTLKPYDGYIKQYNLNPHEIVSNLAAAHTILRFGTPEQKAQVAAILDRDYGLRQYYQQNGQVAAPAHEQVLSPLQNRLAQVEAQLQQRALGDATTEVERFIADPTNKYAADAAPRMLELLESGRATSLREAYDVATRTDPALFEQIIAERVQAAARPTGRPPANLRASAARAHSPAGERGTIEDTMRETLRAMSNR